MKAKRNREMIVETLERITIRLRRGGQRAYCSSCGRSTTWLTAEQAQEIFGSVSSLLESIHVSEAGPAHLLCADSMVAHDEAIEEEK